MGWRDGKRREDRRVERAARKIELYIADLDNRVPVPSACCKRGCVQPRASGTGGLCLQCFTSYIDDLMTSFKSKGLIF